MSDAIDAAIAKLTSEALAQAELDRFMASGKVFAASIKRLRVDGDGRGGANIAAMLRANKDFTDAALNLYCSIIGK